MIEDNDLSVFEKILGKNNVLTEDLDPYNTDFLHIYKGSSKCVLFPTSSEEVSAILRHCYSRNLAVVPQSGNTGLVGGSVPVYDEIVLSLKKLNKNFEFDPHAGVMKCEAGWILEELYNRLAPEGYIIPWDLGSRGSCLIGGNISTGVGGVRRLRFGSLHNHVIGLQVVLADEHGTVVNFGSNVRKDNTNLHIHHLFIGGEGQLGVVTGVTVCVVPKAVSVQVAMLGVNTYSECREVLRLAKQYLGEVLSAFELMDSEAMRCLLENEKLHNVLTSNPPFNLLIEVMGSDEGHDKEKMENFLNAALAKGLAVDGVLAASAQEAAYMWKLRKTLPLAPLHDGYVYKHDISLPMEHFYALSGLVRERLKGLAARVITFGHMADGDSHFNVSAKQYSPEITARLYPFVCEWTVEHGGSISAEHGVGQERRPYAKLGKGYEVRMASMLKRQFDPRHILSPYKMIDC
uniref:D-2-hydroxyglutarate dehydrogenase, mitochondrial n=1 Tax=Parascaris univalens TaxID=6257 RepID=A0A915C694_PARUN